MIYLRISKIGGSQETIEVEDLFDINVSTSRLRRLALEGATIEVLTDQDDIPEELTALIRDLTKPQPKPHYFSMFRPNYLPPRKKTIWEKTVDVFTNIVEIVCLLVCFLLLLFTVPAMLIVAFPEWTTAILVEIVRFVMSFL